MNLLDEIKGLTVEEKIGMLSSIKEIIKNDVLKSAPYKKGDWVKITYRVGRKRPTLTEEFIIDSPDIDWDDKTFSYRCYRLKQDFTPTKRSTLITNIVSIDLIQQKLGLEF